MYTHVAGLWFHDGDPIRSHVDIVARESIRSNIGRILLLALTIATYKLIRQRTCIHLITTYTLYTSIGALAMLRILPPGQISDSIQPQVQLCLLLLVLPKIIYVPAACFACFTSPGIFQLVGVTHITYKLFKCARRTKITKTT